MEVFCAHSSGLSDLMYKTHVMLSCGSRCECVGMRVNERAGVARNFSFVYTLPVYVRVCLSSRLSWRLF